MTLYKNKYRIESARKPGWDYSTPGYYFVTVCTHNRRCLFGNISGGKMILNDFGRIVQNEWDRSFIIRREILRDEFVVMPNHFHGVVRLIDIKRPLGGTTVETPGRASLQEPVPQPIPIIRPKSISSFMGGVKSVITKRINQIRNTPGARVLQYQFHDHIIRNDQELSRIRNYISNNPFNWEKDKFTNMTGNHVREKMGSYGEEPWMI